MAILSTSNPWAFAFGLLGNIISFAVFLAPVPTFVRIVKRKSTEGFDSIPYLVSLFSAMLWIYYASQKHDAFLLITINGFGCVIETLYIALYITYAGKQARRYTLKLMLLVNFGAFSVILLLTYFLTKGSTRVQVLGWICVAFAVSVFAAPLSVMRQVIRTKSVEFMPFPLSFALTISAVVWLVYGLSLKDLYVALPNVLGFIFGVLQMILYGIYRKSKTVEETKLSKKDVGSMSLSEIIIAETEASNENKSVTKEEKNKVSAVDEHPNVMQKIHVACNVEGTLIPCAA